MATKLEDKLAQLSPKRRQRVEEMGKALILEECTLKSLRELLGFTQKETATQLDIEEEGVSRLEQHPDIRLSVLQQYVEALGGSLNIIAEFPNKPPVSLTELAKSTERDI